MINIRRAVEQDVPKVVKLMNQEDENLVTSEQLTNWYFNNHSQSHTLIICEKEAKVEGICSTNHFLFDLEGKKQLIAFPQKVLTSSNIRGQGFFSKLYWTNEKYCFGEEKVDFFINFPNDVSSPIFLKKFDYLPGYCPDLAFILCNPITLLNAPSYKTLDHIPKDFFAAKPLLVRKNGFLKDYSYYNWRYEKPISTESAKYEFLALDNNEGIAIIKKDKKKGLPIYLILDILVKNENTVEKLFNACRNYALSKGCLGILSFVNLYNESTIKKFRLKKILNSQFNFSVKGKDNTATESLSKMKFNFELGDLDFL